MPFQSEKQRRFLHANHPEIAKRWEKEYATGGISNHFRKKFNKGTALASYPPFRGRSGADNLKAWRGQEMLETLAGGALGARAFKFLEDEDQENLPKKIDEEKTPKKEPPEDPDLLPEILNLKDINLDEEKDLTIETEEDFKKLEEEQKYFPFSNEDFEGGALDNEIIKKVYKFVRGDYHDPPQPFDRDKFYLTPPRGQQEIALKFLKQKLIEDEANPKIIEHISKIQKELANSIQTEGYYGAGEAENTGIGKALTEGYGYVKDLKRKKNAHGGILDINESEEIIDDDGNDIELTAYNAAFDDPNDLSTGVKSLFQAKDGGRIGFANGPPGGGDPEMTSGGGDSHDRGGQQHQKTASTPSSPSGVPGGGDKTMTYTAPRSPHYKEEEETRKFAIQEDIRRRQDEKYDTDEQRYQDEYYGQRKRVEKQKRVTKATVDFIQKNLKRLDSKKYYSEKYGDDIIGMLQKGWDVYKSIPAPTLFGIAKELIAEHKLTKEGKALLEEWGDLIGGPPGTNPQAYDDLYYALEKRKAKYRYDDDDTGGDEGQELPPQLGGPSTEEMATEYGMSDLDRIRAGQAKYAAYIEKIEREKLAREENPIVGTTEMDIIALGNSGGLANLFRVKNNQ